MFSTGDELDWPKARAPSARASTRAQHSSLPQASLDASGFERLGSGVCSYASTIEDSDLKLSYDLYYLRHFSTWLDLVILFRTIKTVLKASGR